MEELGWAPPLPSTAALGSRLELSRVGYEALPLADLEITGFYRRACEMNGHTAMQGVGY